MYFRVKTTTDQRLTLPQCLCIMIWEGGGVEIMKLTATLKAGQRGGEGGRQGKGGQSLA